MPLAEQTVCNFLMQMSHQNGAALYYLAVLYQLPGHPAQKSNPSISLHTMVLPPSEMSFSRLDHVCSIFILCSFKSFQIFAAAAVKQSRQASKMTNGKKMRLKCAAGAQLAPERMGKAKNLFWAKIHLHFPLSTLLRICCKILRPGSEHSQSYKSLQMYGQYQYIPTLAGGGGGGSDKNQAIPHHNNLYHSIPHCHNNLHQLPARPPLVPLALTGHRCQPANTACPNYISPDSCFLRIYISCCRK